MKIIVVSSPEKIQNEAELFNDLLAAGLELLHIRKPGMSEEEVCRLIGKTHPEHRGKIVLHHQHQLAEHYGIKRLHFPESERLTLKENQLAELKEKGYVLSTSVHNQKALAELSEYFSYAFLGPVFESISKPGYAPKKDFSFNKENRKTKIIAIGGVTEENLGEVKMKNFDGAALLGSIWTDKNNAVETFTKCTHTVNM